MQDRLTHSDRTRPFCICTHGQTFIRSLVEGDNATSASSMHLCPVTRLVVGRLGFQPFTEARPHILQIMLWGRRPAIFFQRMPPT